MNIIVENVPPKKEILKLNRNTPAGIYWAFVKVYSDPFLLAVSEGGINTCLCISSPSSEASVTARLGTHWEKDHNSIEKLIPIKTVTLRAE
jgi:hypothetical protein